MTERIGTAVIAIGGNSLIPDKQHKQVEYQWQAVHETSKHIVELVQAGWDTIITHGNGPQVGFILRRAELAMPEVHPVTLDLIGADTQGSIGYMIQQSMDNEFQRRGLYRRAITIVTQVLVDKNDPAFQNPTKPIGGFMTAEEAKVFETMGWKVIEDAGRGYRRVIASPKPLEIIEVNAIKSSVNEGWIVIAVGGGGIPVVRNDEGLLEPAPPAVIDKDRASALLARNIQADILIISTAVSRVAINFNKPNQQWLDRMTVSEAKQYMAEGHFAPGSMKPKVEACIDFLEHGGKRAIITDPPHLAQALRGEAGTHILPG
ncbi:MAG TPA: carbamate kinase [Caldilineales bacterium]|nr:carbamate kinase [Caldilineales bacterium]